MNIAFLFFRSFDPQIGGVERVTDILTKELKKRGYNIFYLCFKKVGDQSRLATETYYFPNSEEYVSDENKTFYSRFIKEHKIDICILQEPRFGVNIFELFPKSNCKLISVYHGSPAGPFQNYWKIFMRKTGSTLDYIMKFLPRLIRRLPDRNKLKQKSKRSVELALKWSDAIIYLSDRYITDLELLGINVNNLKFHYIGNPTPYKPLTCFPVKEKIVVFVGRMVPLKNPHIIINIWNKIAKDYPDWKLYFIGDGPLMSFYKNLASKTGNIIFTGQCDPESYYERASILCMASIDEGWPMVLVEAMAKGCVPIVYNSFSSVKEIIKDGEDGVLVQPFSQVEYKHKLCNLLNNAEYRTTLANNAIRKVNQFTLDVIIDKWISLFEEVLEK